MRNRTGCHFKAEALIFLLTRAIFEKISQKNFESHLNIFSIDVLRSYERLFKNKDHLIFILVFKLSLFVCGNSYMKAIVIQNVIKISKKKKKH